MNEEHVAILKSGVDAWNYWRETNLDILPDLKFIYLAGLDLKGSNLKYAQLQKVHLTDVNLNNVNLLGANLYLADLNGVDLTGSRLFGASLRGIRLENANLEGVDLGDANLGAATERMGAKISAKLSGAILRNANLRGTIFEGTNLTNANFEGARTYRTLFTNLDLSTVKGLESIRHEGPSTVGIDTIYRSKGEIPEIFLRGCGVPENLITYIHTLAGQQNAFEFYSCFISYSSKDQTFAERLHADLQNKGVRAWFAPEDLKIGDKFRGKIDEAILIYDKLLLVLSVNSIGSTWVEKEVETAFEKEREQNCTVLFPIRLDNTVMTTTQAWAADIRRTRHIGDFQNWKNHAEYRKAFAQLLRALKAEEKDKEV